MPNRILRDSITESESLSRLTAEEERFFYRLLSKADDYGRFDARPPILRASCFKLMLDSVSDADVAAWLKRLADADIDVVRLYDVGGRPYGVFRHWDLYQRPPRAQESKYPEPPADNGLTISENECCQLTTSDKQCQHMLSDAPVVVVVDGVVSGNGIENEVENENENGFDETAAAAAVSSDFLDELVAAYEANIGPVTPVLADMIVEFDARFHPPPGYGAKAVEEAVAANVRRWSYIAAILERLCAQGGKRPPPRPKRVGKKPPLASRGDPNRYIAEYIRRRGHLPEARDSPPEDTRGFETT